MKRWFFLSICFIVGMCAVAWGYSEGDFQVWNTDVQELNVDKRTKIALEEEFRWGDSASDFFYHHYDLGIQYSLNKHWSIGTGYRQIYNKKNGKFREENQPYLTATLFWDLIGCKFDTRSRFEYKHYDYQTDQWMYRNKLTAKLPWKFTKLEIQPYLSDEIFVRFDDNDNFNQNRFCTGLGMNIAKNIKADIYYMLQSSKGAIKWTDANVLGTKIKLSF